jgi:hypothetical protein
MGSLHSSPDFIILLSDIAANGGTVIADTDSGALVIRQGGGIGGVEEICHSLIFHTDETATMTIESDNDIGVVREVLKEFGLKFHKLANEGRGRVEDFIPHVSGKWHSGIATANKISNGFHGDIVSGDIVSDITSYGIDGHLSFSVVCCFFPYCLNIG